MSSSDFLGAICDSDNRAQRRDELALQAILGRQPVLYINILGDPMIELPFDAAPADRVAYRLRSSRARAAMHATICRDAKFVPYEQEVSRILWVLEDAAWCDVRSDVSYQIAVEHHELVEAIHILLAKPEWREGYDGTASSLRRLLTDTAVENDIDVRQRLWPKGASQLSHQLWELRNTLRGGGILVNRGRSGGQRWIALRRGGGSADDHQVPSPERHDDKSLPSNTVVISDDGDGAIAALLASIQAAPPEENT